ncbi:MAG TPA: ATP-binding protein [Gaiellaceae bacterium]
MSGEARAESLRRRSWRLRTYFALLAGCFVLAAAAAIVYVEVQTGRDARSSGEHDATAAATVAAAQLGNVLRTLRETAANLAANPQVAGVLQQPAGCTLTFDLGNSGAGHVDIIDSKGGVACTSRAKRSGNYANASWFAAARHGQVFRAPVLDPATGAQVAVAAAPISGGKGVVASFLNLGPLGKQLVDLYGGGKPVSVLIVDTHANRVVTRSLDPGRWIGEPVAGTPFAESLHAPARDLSGTKRFFADAAVTGTAWRLFAGEDAHAASAAGTRLEHRELAIILAGLALVLLGSWVAYRRTAQPIVRLAGAVRTHRAGETAEPVPTAGPAEVTELGAGVNALIASVDAELAERRRAEESLRLSEESYRLLFEHHPNPMWLFDPETLRFVAVNDAAIAAYGWSREEFLAMTIDDIRPEEDVDALRGQLDDGERTYVPSQIWRHLRKDGSIIDVAITSNGVEFAGRPVRVVLAQDVTEQRRLEEQLRQAQKMEAIGRLAGGVAHDFNNLLVVIRGYSGALAEALERDEELQRQAVAIDQAGERAASLTRQLLAFSRRQVLRPAVVSVNDVVSETRSLLDRVIGEDVQLTTELEPEPWRVLADPGQLVQVILNLAVNARDAMPDGGTLSIRTGNVELDAEYAAGHVGVDPGQYVLLQVTDSGVGMDRETQEHVFEPFFTTKEEGTGLGLATVHGIVRQSGGHIWLYSEPGLGTTFKLYLRRTELAPVAAAPAPDAARLGGDETLLLVEDDEGVRTFVSLTLAGRGYRVLEADRADTAEQIAASADGIDLLITDVVMPGRSGRELADRLQAAKPGLRVLFTSGYPGDAVLRSDAADTDFLEKPFGPLELARAVRRLLDRDTQNA